MAEKRSSDNVVIPNITELSDPDPLAISAERNTEDTDSGIKTIRRANETNGVGMPVSMPVRALIAGTTYNVITSEHLHHFKPMICVDNGFISGGPVQEDVKQTHIVIQNPVSRDKDRDATTNTPPLRSRSWMETASMPVLPIRCKNTSAELHKNRLGSGGRGRCIRYEMEWYTPSEFEALCGRASSKDWKRSIRFGGRSIQALIDEGILTPHATSCTCGACCDDQTAMGPVRLFTPYKRKRRNPDGQDDKKSKVKLVTLSDAEVENIHQTSSNSFSKEAWQTIADGPSTDADYSLLTDTPEMKPTIPMGQPNLNKVLKRLEDIGQNLIRLSTELKQCVDEVRSVNNRQIERFEQERASCIIGDSVDAQVDAEQIALHNVEHSESNKCANCNREASSECSLCRRTPYCSTYCQKKDWAAHQIECLRSVPTIHADNQQQSIMLIVESQPQ